MYRPVDDLRAALQGLVDAIDFEGDEGVRFSPNTIYEDERVTEARAALRRLELATEPSLIGKKVNAIKRYRTETGASLLEAKNYVEAHPSYIEQTLS
jgi:ribosomal protein L7/L12